jgi:predicted oxidoreductase (fatty acid repression mutant protein)
MDVCSTVADFGGRSSKKALIKNMIANEDKEFIDELVQDQCKLVPSAKESLSSQIHIHGDGHDKYLNSEEDENYSSAEESIIDVDDEQIYQYQYFDFENN